MSVFMVRYFLSRRRNFFHHGRKVCLLSRKFATRLRVVCVLRRKFPSLIHKKDTAITNMDKRMTALQ